MSGKPIALLLIGALLVMAPALAVPHQDAGAAWAKDGGNGGGGKGGGKGGGNSGGNGSGGKSGGNGKAETAGKSGKSAEGKPADTGRSALQGALDASIGSVLTQIRRGEVKGGKSPVALLAGLAVSDTIAARAAEDVATLAQLDKRFKALERGLRKAGFKSVAEYLEVRNSGILTGAEMAKLDPLVEAVGGTRRDGLELAVARPDARALAGAEARLSEARAAVAAAETAIATAMAGEGRPAEMLAALRRKLAPHKTRIAAALP